MGEGEIGGRDYIMVAAAFAESAGALGNMATLRELVSWVNSGETPVYANYQRLEDISAILRFVGRQDFLRSPALE